MKMLFLLTALVVVSNVGADELICPKQSSKGEGSWPIPESAFTKEAAKAAMQKLNVYLSAGTSSMDSVVIDNQILMVRGYLLKERVKNDVPDARAEFCAFMREQAYVQH